MSKALRRTSAAAVLLAVVVLASVLGFLRPASLVPLNLGVHSDKQTEKILSGPSAVDRFKEQYGNKVPDGQGTTPPLVKQAEAFANIINPPAPDGTRPTAAFKNVPKPIAAAVKPTGPVSSKFDLLATCCSSDPKTSFAQIRLADGTYQWVGVGSEIGHVTIKEIHNGSIVCSDGGRDFPMNTQATPETSSLLETGKVPKDAASLKAQASTEPAASGRGPNVKPQMATAANTPASPAKPTVGSAKATALGAAVGANQQRGAGEPEPIGQQAQGRRGYRPEQWGGEQADLRLQVLAGHCAPARERAESDQHPGGREQDRVERQGERGFAPPVAQSSGRAAHAEEIAGLGTGFPSQYDSVPGVETHGDRVVPFSGPFRSCQCRECGFLWPRRELFVGLPV